MYNIKNKKKLIKQKKIASAGNRTRIARVAGEHSTIEPPMLVPGGKFEILKFFVLGKFLSFEGATELSFFLYTNFIRL